MAKQQTQQGSQVKDVNKGQDKPKKEKKVKVKRVEFPLPKTAKDGKFQEAIKFGAFNDKGEFVVTDGQFSPKLHLPPKKKAFENSCDYLDFQASMLEYKGGVTIQKAKAMRNKAIKFRTLGDEKQRKSVTKLSKMAKMMKEMRAELEKDLGAETLEMLLSEKAESKG